MQSIIDAAERGEIALRIAVVISNNPQAKGLERARNVGIPVACVEDCAFADRQSFDRALAETIDGHAPDFLILAGFMRILTPEFVTHYQGRILNIHPSLLPAYPGLDTHQRALDAGEKWHGSTVHFVTEQLDGGPRILQARLAVDARETAEGLCARVQAAEHEIYPQAADWFGQGRVEFRNGAAWMDGGRLRGPVVRDYPQR